MDGKDPYAFCYQVEMDPAKALDKAGLAAFERVIRARFEAIPSEQRHDRGRWGDVLRAIYLAQGNPAACEALAEQIGLELRDCLALAKIFVSRKPDLALTWVDRGIELDRRTTHAAAGYHRYSWREAA